MAEQEVAGSFLAAAAECSLPAEAAVVAVFSALVGELALCNSASYFD